MSGKNIFVLRLENEGYNGGKQTKKNDVSNELTFPGKAKCFEIQNE